MLSFLAPVALTDLFFSFFFLCSTVSRLSVGFLADYLSAPKPKQPPPPSANTPALSDLAREAEEIKVQPYQHNIHLSKPHMLLITITMMLAIYIFSAAGGLKDVDRLWVLTTVIGWSYGTIFVSGTLALARSCLSKSRRRGQVRSGN